MSTPSSLVYGGVRLGNVISMLILMLISMLISILISMLTSFERLHRFPQLGDQSKQLARIRCHQSVKRALRCHLKGPKPAARCRHTESESSASPAVIRASLGDIWISPAQIIFSGGAGSASNGLMAYLWRAFCRCGKARPLRSQVCARVISSWR
jgi:hypothetical protein